MRKFFFTIITLIAFSAAGETNQIIPAMPINNVRVTIVINVLAKAANSNYLVQPNLYGSPEDANYPAKSEPTVTLKWEQTNASKVLDEVLAAHGLVKQKDAFSTVTFITRTNFALTPVDTNLLVSTSAAADTPTLFGFTYMQVNRVLQALLVSGNFDIKLDPSLNPAGDNDPITQKIHMQPMVSLRWKNLTPKQAIVAICEAYGLVIVKDAATGVVTIKPQS